MPRGAEKGDTRPPAECWLCRAVWHREGRWAGGQGRRGASSVQPGCWAGIRAGTKAEAQQIVRQEGAWGGRPHTPKTLVFPIAPREALWKSTFSLKG